MPLLGFTMFKDKLLDGSKTQTVRRLRKKPIKVGDKLYLYWHLRQKNCEKLSEEICAFTQIIQIHNEYCIGRNRLVLYEPPIGRKGIWHKMTIAETEEIARRDGFANANDMLVWFTLQYPLPDVFQIIRWGKR